MAILVTGVFAEDDQIKLTLEGLTKGGDPATHTFSVTLPPRAEQWTFRC